MLLLSTLVVTVATAGPTPLANCLQASRLQRGGEPEQVDAEDIAAAELTAAHAGEQVSQDSLPLPALVQRQASRLQRDGESEQVDAEVIAAAEHTAADAGEQVSKDSLPLPLLSARGNVGSMSYVGILYIFFWSLGAITP